MRTPRVTAPTMLTLMVKTSKRSAKELAADAGLDSPDFLGKIQRGERGLTEKTAVAISRACGRDPAFLVGLTVAHNHPELWSDLHEFPHALLDYNEREMVKTYWLAAPDGRRKRLILEAFGVNPDEYVREKDEEDE